MAGPWQEVKDWWRQVESLSRSAGVPFCSIREIPAVSLLCRDACMLLSRHAMMAVQVYAKAYHAYEWIFVHGNREPILTIRRIIW